MQTFFLWKKRRAQEFSFSAENCHWRPESVKVTGPPANKGFAEGQPTFLLATSDEDNLIGAAADCCG